MNYPHVIQAIHTFRVRGDSQRKMQRISMYKLIPDSTQGENYQKRGVHNSVIVKDPLNLKYVQKYFLILKNNPNPSWKLIEKGPN